MSPSSFPGKNICVPDIVVFYPMITQAEERERERAAQDEQGQAEAEGLRRSQCLRGQRNQSDQHSI